MSNNTEIELKFLVNKKALAKLLDSGVLQIEAESRKTRRLVSSYYDTEDFAFKNNGIAYRVRDKGDGSFEATVKTDRKSSAGLSERVELNLPLQKNEAVLEGFEELGLEQSLRLLAPNGVVKLFTVDVERTTYILLQGASKIEMAIDLGKIRARGRKTVPVDELELELLEGEKQDLLELAGKIAQELPLFVEKRSKYARGMALLGVATEIPVAKEKMRGPIRRELMKMVNYHGDVLLELQNQINGQKAMTEELIVALRKPISFICSYLKLMQQVMNAQADYSELTAIAENWKDRLDHWQLMAELQQEWQDLLVLDPALGKNDPLQKLLQQEQLEDGKILQQRSKKGELTYLIYTLLTVLERAELPQEDFPQADTVVIALCDTLQQEMLNLEDKAEQTAVRRYQLLELLLCLSKSVKGKRFGHLHDGWKKQAKQVRELYLWQQELLQLQNWLKSAEEKALVRNLGVLYGSIL